MFVRLLLSISLLGTAFAQSNDQGIFSGSQAAKEGAPGILPDMFKALIGQKSSTPKISTAELQRIMRRNAAIIFHSHPGEQFSTGHVPGPVNIPPEPRRPLERNLSVPDPASQ